MDRPKRVAIVGVGNTLLKDEGLGVHVARALQEMVLPDGVEVIDGGTSPDVLDYIDPPDKLIIVDAVEAGGEPGSVYRFRPGDVDLDTGAFLSLHDMGLVTSLKLMALLGKAPRRVIIIGIQPREIDWGTEITPELRDKLPAIISIVLNEIDGEEDD